MSMICEICGKREAVARCSYCSRNVCDRCVTSAYGHQEQVCRICEQLMCQVCSSRLSVTKCLLCNRLICRYCSVELDEVRRVCSECFSQVNDINEIKAIIKSHQEDFLKEFRKAIESITRII